MTEHTHDHDHCGCQEGGHDHNHENCECKGEHGHDHENCECKGEHGHDHENCECKGEHGENHECCHGHDHHHHEEKEYITLVDEEGNESLFEILLTVDGQEQFGKNYVLLYPAGVSEDEDVELFAYAYEDDEEGNAGQLNPIETDAEWDMVEEVLGAFLDEDEANS